MTVRALLVVAMVSAAVGVGAQGAAVNRTSAQVAVTGTAGGLAATLIAPTGQAKMTTCFLRLETAEIRWTDDGTTVPTSTVGTLLEPGDSLVLNGYANLSQFQAIRTTTTSGQLDATCGGGQ